MARLPTRLAFSRSRHFAIIVQICDFSYHTLVTRSKRPAKTSLFATKRDNRNSFRRESARTTDLVNLRPSNWQPCAAFAETLDSVQSSVLRHVSNNLEWVSSVWRLLRYWQGPRIAQSSTHARTKQAYTHNRRESFENIYLDLSKQQGKCRFADSGLGWKPSGGGDTFTLDKSEIVNAQWSRAARGHEVKIASRNQGVIQLDGFHQDVWQSTHLPEPS